MTTQRVPKSIGNSRKTLTRTVTKRKKRITMARAAQSRSRTRTRHHVAAQTGTKASGRTQQKRIRKTKIIKAGIKAKAQRKTGAQRMTRKTIKATEMTRKKIKAMER